MQLRLQIEEARQNYEFAQAELSVRLNDLNQLQSQIKISKKPNMKRSTLGQIEEYLQNAKDDESCRSMSIIETTQNTSTHQSGKRGEGKKTGKSISKSSTEDKQACCDNSGCIVF